MTGKVKLALVCFAAGLIMAVGFFCGWGLKARLSREPELSALLAAERRARESCENKAVLLQRAAYSVESAGKENAFEWRQKDTGEKIQPPEDCKACIEKAAHYVRIEDKKNGWWVYRDDNALDDQPGEFELTGKFYSDATALIPVTDTSPHENGKAVSDEDSHVRSIGMGKPVKSVRASVGLTSYNAEFDYEPMVIEGPRARVSLGLRSAISLDRMTSNIAGDLSAGIRISW